MLVDFWLWNNIKSGDLLLNLTNLPPLIKPKGVVKVYLHNRYLVEKNFYSQNSPFADMRIFVERFLLRKFSKNVDQFIVQTGSMKLLLESKINRPIPIKELPFIPIFNSNVKSRNLDKRFDFLYVSSGEKHKNHLKLFEAWKLLYEEGFSFSICVTLNQKKFPDLCSIVDNLILKGINITNVGEISSDEVGKFYDCSDALIFPSVIESLGLPLLEARQRKMPILAAELDYVRDLINPCETFDPNSHISIARAVRRFRLTKTMKFSTLTPQEFLDSIN